MIKNLDIYSLIMPIYYLSKMFGLSAMSVRAKQHKGRRLYTSLFSVLYTMFLILVIVAANIIVIINYERLPNPGERTRGIIVLEMLTYCITAVLGMGVTLIKHRSMLNILLFKISIFDELLILKNTNMIKINRIFICIQIIVLISVFLCFDLADFILIILDKGTSLTWQLCLICGYIATFINAIIITQFVDFVKLLKQKIHILNNSIKLNMIPAENINEDILFKEINFYDLENLKTQGTYVENFEEIFKGWCNSYMSKSFNNALKICRNNDRMIRIQALRILQDILFDICDLINSIYGFQMLIFTVGNFISITSALSYGIISLLPEDHLNKKVHLFAKFPFLWAFLYFTMQLCPMASCSTASNESHQTAILIQKLLMIPEVDRRVVAELQLFSQQLNTRQIEFTAMGFFGINYRNLGAIVGACLTILIMLLQFQNVNNLF